MSDEELEISPGVRAGIALLNRWHAGEHLKRRERRALVMFLAVTTATESEHICVAVREERSQDNA